MIESHEHTDLVRTKGGMQLKFVSENKRAGGKKSTDKGIWIQKHVCRLNGIKSTSIKTPKFHWTQTMWHYVNVLKIVAKPKRNSTVDTYEQVFQMGFSGFQRFKQCHFHFNCSFHAEKHLQRNVKYEALWQMNLINGFRIVWPIRECGATMYVIENSGNSIPAKRIGNEKVFDYFLLEIAALINANPIPCIIRNPLHPMWNVCVW